MFGYTRDTSHHGFTTDRRHWKPGRRQVETEAHHHASHFQFGYWGVKPVPKAKEAVRLPQLVASDNKQGPEPKVEKRSSPEPVRFPRIEYRAISVQTDPVEIHPVDKGKPAAVKPKPATPRLPELTEKLTAAERGELRNKYSQKRLLDTSTANYLYALRLRSGATPRDIVIKAKQVGFADSDIQHEADILTSLKHSAIICSLFTLSTKTGMALVLPRYECALDQALLGKSKCIPANTFTFEFICKTMSDIGEGLIYMHDKGIYHNDLRADNILLDKQKYAVICDFDLASTARDPEVKLDPRFAFNTVVAPEIYDKKKGADHVRVDIFGACSILHSMLSKHTAALYCKWVEHYGSKYSRVHRDKGVNALHWRLQGKPNSAQAAFVHDHVALKGLRLNPNDRQSSMTDVLKGLKPPS